MQLLSISLLVQEVGVSIPWPIKSDDSVANGSPLLRQFFGALYCPGGKPRR